MRITAVSVSGGIESRSRSYGVSVFTAPDSNVQHLCILKNCINPNLQPRSPVMDHRGDFYFKQFTKQGELTL